MKTIYYCQGITEATDKANIYYINSPRAWNIVKNIKGKNLTIQDKKGGQLAVFAY